MHRTIVTLLLGLLLPLTAQAATYWLSPTGSDSAVCSEAQPCKSFSTALPLLRPGDTLVLQAGTYAQAVKIGNPPVTAGTAAAPITIKGQPGAVIHPASGVVGADITGNTQYWTLEDLTFDCSKLSSSTSTVNCISINWRSGPQDSPQATSHITLRRLTLRHTSNPAGTNSIGLAIAAWHNTIADMTIDGTHLQPGDRQGSHGIYLSGGSHNRLIGGKVTNVGGCGVQLNDSGQNPNGNRDNVVMGVWIEANGNRTTGGGACGLTVYHNMQDTRVIANVIVNNRGAGILHEGRNNTGSVLVHNTVASNTGNCLTAGNDSSHPSTATTFQNNICAQNGGGLRFGPYADGAVVANILSDQSPPQGEASAHSNLLDVDPQFVNAAAGDYQPQATSPACQSGEPISGVTKDRRGRGTGREPTMGALPCVGQTPVPPEPPQPPLSGLVLACEGHVTAVPGAVTMQCQQQQEGR
jgi:hypothetical protein